MSYVTAGYFDGVTSARHEVQLFLEKNTLRIHGDDISLSYPLSTVKVSGSVGSVIRTIKLPDDGVCEVTDADFIADLEKESNRPVRERWIHLWEKSPSLIFAGLVLLGVVVAIFLRDGVPFMAYHVVREGNRIFRRRSLGIALLPGHGSKCYCSAIRDCCHDGRHGRAGRK